MRIRNKNKFYGRILIVLGTILMLVLAGGNLLGFIVGIILGGSTILYGFDLSNKEEAE